LQLASLPDMRGTGAADVYFNAPVTKQIWWDYKSRRVANMRK